MSNYSSARSPAASPSPARHASRVSGVHRRLSQPTSSTTCRRKRVTFLEVLLNTNQTATSAAVVDDFHEYLSQRLFTEHGLETLLVPAMERPDRRLIQRVDIQAAAIEVSPHQRRVHAHFIMRILHLDAQLHIGRLARLLQEHMRANSPFQTPFASVRLLNGRPENYALKESCVEVPDDENLSVGHTSK